jgi:hypothetical protein
LSEREPKIEACRAGRVCIRHGRRNRGTGAEVIRDFVKGRREMGNRGGIVEAVVVKLTRAAQNLVKADLSEKYYSVDFIE